MKNGPLKFASGILFATTFLSVVLLGQASPDKLKFVRQGVQRMIFDEDQSIPLASLEPGKIIGLSVMHPVSHYLDTPSKITISEDQLLIQSEGESQTGIWFGGFNPFATYTLDLSSCVGEGDIGFEFSDADREEQFFVTVGFEDSLLTGANLRVINNSSVIADESISVNLSENEKMKGKIILCTP